MNHTAHYRTTLPHQIHATTTNQMQPAFPGRFPATTTTGSTAMDMNAAAAAAAVAVMLPGLHQDPTAHVQYTAHMQPFATTREQQAQQAATAPGHGKKRAFNEPTDGGNRTDARRDSCQDAYSKSQQEFNQQATAQQYLKPNQGVPLSRSGRVMVDVSTMTDPEEDDASSNWQNVSVPTNTKVAEYLSSLRQFLKLSTPGEGKKKRQLGDVRIMTGADGTRLFCCPECHVAYPDKSLLEPHLAGHKIERRWLCGVCGAGLKRKEHLDRHQLCHSDERPYACAACPKAFKRNEHLARHYVTHSGDKAQRSGSKGGRYSGSGCKKGIVGVSMFDNGGGGIVGGASLTLPVPSASVSFPTHHHLPQLKMVPSSTANVMDPSKIFASFTSSTDCPTSYSLHIPPVAAPINSHPISNQSQKVVEKKYMCTVCGLGHARREHLERHQVSHSEERPYTCGACGKAFKRNEHLARHVAIHSGLKAHACDDCGKAFFRKDHLSKHLAGHHGAGKHLKTGNTSASTTSGTSGLLL